MTDREELAAEFWKGRCLDCAHPEHEMTCHELIPNGDPGNGPAYCPCAVHIDLMEQEIVRLRTLREPLDEGLLDAERLAHAYNNVRHAGGRGVGIPMPQWHAIAAEYRALAAKEPKP